MNALNPLMMEQIKQKQSELSRKKSVKTNNNVLQNGVKENNLKNNEYKEIKKDIENVQEKNKILKKNKILINIDNNISDEHFLSKIDNINENEIVSKRISAPIPMAKQQMEIQKKNLGSIHISQNKKIDIDNFSNNNIKKEQEKEEKNDGKNDVNTDKKEIEWKNEAKEDEEILIKEKSEKNEKEDNNDIIKINDIQQTGINESKERTSVKKRTSLLDENNKLRIKLKSKNNYKKEDFEIINFSGKGAYGTVLQVYLVNDPKKKIYAIKKLDINSLISVNRLYQAYLENDVLSELDSPFIVKVYGAFESDEKIHIVMDYLPKGDFSYFIKSNYPLREDIIKFYAAEMVLFLEYLQKNKLIHRDLKPQNIMIDGKGHLKVIDFGTVRKVGYYFDKKEMRFKEDKTYNVIDSDDIKGVKSLVNPDEQDVDEEDEENEEEDDENNDNNNENGTNKKKGVKVRIQRSMTFVGTAEYISPEVIADKPAEYGTDIWAFGVMLYQMIYNTTPFKAATNYLIFRKIEHAEYEFPKDSNDISEEAKDLIKKIFIVEPKKRLGGGDPGTENDMAHLKKHKYFKGIKWETLHNMKPPGFEGNKYYESKKKSIYKKGKSKNQSDGYAAFDDKSNNNNIKTIKEGYIKKKSSWFHYEKRYIVLDSTPRIIVKNVNESSNKVIPLNNKCKISIVENNCFDVKTPEKNHRFKGLSNDGNDWAGIISDAINAYAKD